MSGSALFSKVKAISLIGLGGGMAYMGSEAAYYLVVLIRQLGDSNSIDLLPSLLFRFTCYGIAIVSGLFLVYRGVALLRGRQWAPIQEAENLAKDFKL